MKSDNVSFFSNRPVGLALNWRSNRKSVGSPEARPLSSTPPTSVIVMSIYRFVQYCIARRQNGHAIRMLAMAERGGVPMCRLAMGVHAQPCSGSDSQPRLDSHLEHMLG
eukprot:4892934-Pleurochrysis_carterae.AAC.1